MTETKKKKSERDILTVQIKRSQVRCVLVMLGIMAHHAELPAPLKKVRKLFQTEINRQ